MSKGCSSQVILAGITIVHKLLLPADFSTSGAKCAGNASNSNTGWCVPAHGVKILPNNFMTSTNSGLFTHADFLRIKYTLRARRGRTVAAMLFDKTGAAATTICGNTFWISASSQMKAISVNAPLR